MNLTINNVDELTGIDFMVALPEDSVEKFHIVTKDGHLHVIEDVCYVETEGDALAFVIHDAHDLKKIKIKNIASVEIFYSPLDQGSQSEADSEPLGVKVTVVDVNALAAEKAAQVKADAAAKAESAKKVGKKAGKISSFLFGEVKDMLTESVKEIIDEISSEIDDLEKAADAKSKKSEPVKNKQDVENESDDDNSDESVYDDTCYYCGREMPLGECDGCHGYNEEPDEDDKDVHENTDGQNDIEARQQKLSVTLRNDGRFISTVDGQCVKKKVLARELEELREGTELRVELVNTPMGDMTVTGTLKHGEYETQSSIHGRGSNGATGSTALVDGKGKISPMVKSITVL